MTFLVNHQGVIHEKDVEPQTAAPAGRMTAFNPDGTWRRVEDGGQPSAGAR